MTVSDERLAKLRGLFQRSVELRREAYVPREKLGPLIAAIDELQQRRLRDGPCCKGLAPASECKCLRDGPTPAGDTPICDAWLADFGGTYDSETELLFSLARTLERKCAAQAEEILALSAAVADEAVRIQVISELTAKCAAQREALESIRIFARDCIDTGHDRGALGNLYAIVDLCDRLAANGEKP